MYLSEADYPRTELSLAPALTGKMPTGAHVARAAVAIKDPARLLKERALKCFFFFFFRRVRSN